MIYFHFCQFILFIGRKVISLMNPVYGKVLILCPEKKMCMKKTLVIHGLFILFCITGCIQQQPMSRHPDQEYTEINTNHGLAQVPYSGEPIKIEAAGIEYTLVPVAQYSASVLVVGRKVYYDEDRELVPLDLCVAWGLLADPEYLRYTSFTQQDRACTCIYDEGSPVDNTDVLTQFVNIHLIPASESILHALNTIKKGDTILLEGYLVDIYHGEQIYIETSTVWTDSGIGSCEVLFVTGVRIGTEIYT
jgi:hypothetical protein